MNLNLESYKANFQFEVVCWTGVNGEGGAHCMVKNTGKL